MKRKTSRKPQSLHVKRSGKSKATRTKKLSKRRLATEVKPAQVKPADAIDGLVAASAQVLGLNIEPAWYGGVKFNLQLILRLGTMVDEFPLPNDTEPVPVFHA
jgi:Protein of unknown function (DUF4089)